LEPAATGTHEQEADVLTSILFILVAVLAVGEFLLFGALAEAYRGIRQLTEHPGTVGRYNPVDLGIAMGKRPSEVGMDPELDSAVGASVVYLANRCGTCRTIISSLSGGFPQGIWLMIIAESSGEAFGWLRDGGLSEESPAASRITVVSSGDIEKYFGNHITPLAIEIENGRLARAKTVGTVKQFYALVPSTLTLAAPLQEEGVSA